MAPGAPRAPFPSRHVRDGSPLPPLDLPTRISVVPLGNKRPARRVPLLVRFLSPLGLSIASPIFTPTSGGNSGRDEPLSSSWTIQRYSPRWMQERLRFLKKERIARRIEKLPFPLRITQDRVRSTVSRCDEIVWIGSNICTGWDCKKFSYWTLEWGTCATLTCQVKSTLFYEPVFESIVSKMGRRWNCNVIQEIEEEKKGEEKGKKNARSLKIGRVKCDWPHISKDRL